MSESNTGNARQLIYWRLLSAACGASEQLRNFEGMSKSLTERLELPDVLLDPKVSITNVLQRYPDLKPLFEDPFPEGEDAAIDDQSLRRGLVFSKLLLNSFGPNTTTATVSAQQFSNWRSDRDHLMESIGGRSDQPGEGVEIDAEDIKKALQGVEGKMIQRMALREVLKNTKLAKQLTPSMALIEQLLLDKENLSGVALENAKRLIKRYVDELGDVLRLEVASASAGEIDYSVPPKRVFRNLDLKRTIWKNLTNWDPKEERLYVDRLYYHHTSRRLNKTRLIIVVDQSGSMVDAMVNCTILASIFAGLPKVDAHLIAFDTRAIDLTSWVNDPFEVLLRTQLGGGTHGIVAMDLARPKIVDPGNTVMVWISDFYDSHALFDHIKSVHESGVTFIPVGSVNSSGYYSLCSWYKTRLKQMGTPVISGSIKHLIRELKAVLPS